MQKNEEKGDAEFKENEFSNAADFYTKGIKVNCKDLALKAVLYKKRAASHFFLGEFWHYLFSSLVTISGGVVASWLVRS